MYEKISKHLLCKYFFFVKCYKQEDNLMLQFFFFFSNSTNKKIIFLSFSELLIIFFFHRISLPNQRDPLHPFQLYKRIGRHYLVQMEVHSVYNYRDVAWQTCIAEPVIPNTHKRFTSHYSISKQLLPQTDHPPIPIKIKFLSKRFPCHFKQIPVQSNP